MAQIDVCTVVKFILLNWHYFSHHSDYLFTAACGRKRTVPMKRIQFKTGKQPEIINPTDLTTEKKYIVNVVTFDLSAFLSGDVGSKLVLMFIAMFITLAFTFLFGLLFKLVF